MERLINAILKEMSRQFSLELTAINEGRVEEERLAKQAQASLDKAMLDGLSAWDFEHFNQRKKGVLGRTLIDWREHNPSLSLRGEMRLIKRS